MTETPASYSTKPETRGRKSLPVDKRKPPQSTVKINDAILPFVKELKGNLKNKTLTPDILQSLFDALNGKESNQDIDLQAENKELNALVRFQNQKLYELNDKPLAEENKLLKAQIEQLEHKEHACQALTNLGIRCKKPAKLKTKWHGVEIDVCLQHSNK